MEKMKHMYSTNGTNKGRVEVDPKGPGEIGMYDMSDGVMKGKARIPASFPPDRAMDLRNEGGYRAMSAGDMGAEGESMDGATQKRKMPGQMSDDVTMKKRMSDM